MRRPQRRHSTSQATKPAAGVHSPMNLSPSSSLEILISLFVYADRRFLRGGRELLLRTISASSKNLLLLGGSFGRSSQPIFGGGRFRLCDGAIHRSFFPDGRSPFLAFLEP